ncbi:MAG: hypothetical protein AAFU83_01320 [Bacteroidota bacterium]
MPTTPPRNPGTTGSGSGDTAQLLLQVTQLLAQVTTNMNSRPVPEPVRFVLGSGRPLSDFLREFEAYAEKTYGSDRTLWTPRLAKYLDGPVLNLYSNVTQMGLDYDSVKTALMDSYGKLTTATIADLLTQLDECTYDPSEGICSFVSRLSAIAARTYDGVPQDTIQEVVKKRCLASIPEALRSPLNFWLLSNPNASLKDMMRVGAGLEKSLPTPEVAAIAIPSSTVTPETQAVKPKIPVRSQPETDTSAQADPVEPRKICSYCHKFGHTFDECCRRTGSCYRCGELGHFIPDCPLPPGVAPVGRAQYRARPPPRCRSPQTPPYPNVQPRPRMPFGGINSQVHRPGNPVSMASPSGCLFCGDPAHVMRFCPYFEERIEAVVDKKLNR